MKKSSSSAAHRPPANWRDLYSAVVAARRSIAAPVDTLGCDQLHDRSAPREVQRFQKLLGLMLSPQTKDEKTAQAMRNLRRYGCTVEKMNFIPRAELVRLIAPVGFRNRKGHYIQEACKIIIEQHKGKVPRTLQALCALPGVGTKVASLFMLVADGKCESLGVDVHVHRIALRWRWVPTSADTPEKARAALEHWLPKDLWPTVNKVLVGFGQTVCLPRWPRCLQCPASHLCPAAFKEESPQQRRLRLAVAARRADDDIEDLTGANKGSSKRRRGPPRKKARVG